MTAIRFSTVIGDDGTIQVPAGTKLAPGQAEIIVLQKMAPTNGHGQVAEASSGPDEHLFDRLARLAGELGVDPAAFPPDLAENHDHYAHGSPKGID